MVKFAADENLNNNLLRGLQRRAPGLDVVRLQDEGLTGFGDPEVLEWCYQQQRILLTHDIKTMPGHLGDRQRQGLPGPAVFLIKQPYSMARVIEDLVTVFQCSALEEWMERCTEIPLLS